MKEYLKNLGRGFWNVFITVDQAANVMLGLGITVFRGESVHYGEPDETISSVLGRKDIVDGTNFLEDVVITFLDYLDDNHVFEAIERDIPPKNRVLTVPKGNR